MALSLDDLKLSCASLLDQAFSLGVASVLPPVPAITQAELDAAVSAEHAKDKAAVDAALDPQPPAAA